ncbi:nuclear transport factor 2 family protein, partial [Amaricoccus sp. W119]|uniref:nuclear transport factor 2 family protein n=1 Tax=Amaricoccus sp. W119 TaxID=3391833 RepID=UPI0039A622B5
MLNRTEPEKIVRAAYTAYLAHDRAALEALFAPNYRFTSPLDNGIDRATYFERCWPSNGDFVAFEAVVSTAEQNQAVGRRKSRPLGAASGERREGVARLEFPACG